MTISIKPTASGSTIEQDGSTILTVDGSGNLDVTNNLTVSGNQEIVTTGTFNKLEIKSADISDLALTDTNEDKSWIWSNRGNGNLELIYEYPTNTFQTRMQIDSSGYVTEPNKPMAFAVSAPATSTSPGSPIVLKYANAAYNPSSDYNPTTGLFTCPVAGRYKVTQHSMAIASSYNFSISITKNGGGVTNGYTSNTTYNISTCMAIINCAANDTLSATLNHGHKHAGYDSFTVEFLG